MKTKLASYGKNQAAAVEVMTAAGWKQQMEEKKKFISEVDLNKSSKACSPCSLECEKINKRVNNRKLSEIKTEEVPHILKVFDF